MPLDTIIEFQNCSILQKDSLILSEVSFRVDKGEFVYLIGKDVLIKQEHVASPSNREITMIRLRVCSPSTNKIRNLV